MHKMRAKPEKRYGSRTLLLPSLLAHKVIHSFCAQSLAAAGVFGCHLFAHREISQWNQGLHLVSTALLTILSTKDVQKRAAAKKCCVKEDGTSAKFAIFSTNGLYALFLRRGKLCIRINGLSYSQSSCAQSYPQKMCRTSALVDFAWHNLRGRGFVPTIPHCLVFVQHKNFLINQRSFLQLNRLRTILSTKDVQNVAQAAPVQNSA
jgi:hypothetical protein